MQVKMDTVKGHEIDRGIGFGYIVRTGIIIAAPGELDFLIPQPDMLTAALESVGVPALGSDYPATGWDGYKLKRHRVNSIDARHYTLQCIYEYRGLLTVRDTTTLSSVQTQIHPADDLPLYVEWTDPTNPNYKIKKVASFGTSLPLRHLIASQTITYADGAAVLAALPAVNDAVWKGLPKGYWLISALDGMTDDEGVTYSYSVTLTTKSIEDWSQINFLRDDQGEPLPVPEADVTALRGTAYAYGQDSTVNGLLKVGLYPTVNFSTLFGF